MYYIINYSSAVNSVTLIYRIIDIDTDTLANGMHLCPHLNKH